MLPVLPLAGRVAMAVIVIAACAGAGCPDRCESTTRSHSSSSAERAACGNGVVEEGEECDHGLLQRGTCPDGWGVCRTCVPDCRLALARHQDVVYGTGPQLDRYITDGSTDLAVRVDEYRIMGDERLLERSTTTAFDQRGRWRRLAYDEDGDGELDRATSFEYDSHGHRVRQWREGAPDSEERWKRTYDRQSRLIALSHIDHDDDEPGAPWKYEYDGRGNLVREIFALPDGRTNVTTLEYRDGRLWKRMVRHDGEQMQSEADQVYEYTDSGLPRAMSLVYGGREVARTSWTYEDGRLISRQEDHDLDGHPEARQTFTYDASGLVRTTDHLRGVVATTTFERDAEGRVTVARTDEDSDGVIDGESVFHYDDALFRAWKVRAPRRRIVGDD